MAIKNAFILAILSILLFLIGCSKDEPDPEPIPESQDTVMGLIDTTVMVDVGGYELYVETKGEGPITIIFENGLGSFLDEWKVGVYDGIGLEHQMIIYNRAGYLPSETAPDSIDRHIVQIARELKVVIDSVAQNEKVVLVGHSLGGPIIRSFVKHYPTKAKAMLFVDPAHEGDYTESSIAAFQDSMLNEVIPDVPSLHYLRSEVEELTLNWAIQNNLPQLPYIPVTVLTAMSLVEPDGFVYTPEERQAWFFLHWTLGAGVSEFTHLSSDEVSHFIHEEDPDMVINALLDLID